MIENSPEHDVKLLIFLREKCKDVYETYSKATERSKVWILQKEL